jgi:hypothetical protein
MTPRLSRWAAPASLTLAAFALSACAGGNLAATPSAQGFNQSASAGAPNAERPQIANSIVSLTASCPSEFFDCITVSKSKGAQIIWCYGPSSNPCGDSDAGKAKWSGKVCLTKTPTCKRAIKVLTAKWTGPFKCKTKDKCKGTFELDTLIPHAGLKVTQQYIYKQDIHVCVKGGSCEDVYVGINVEK